MCHDEWYLHLKMKGATAIITRQPADDEAPAPQTESIVGCADHLPSINVANENEQRMRWDATPRTRRKEASELPGNPVGEH